MPSISASLLGTARITADGVPAALPFKQAEALLYYLLVEREVSRSKIAGIIWGDTFDERKVKSSMRNALYILRKTFGHDFLTEPRKNVIQINPAFPVELDLDRLREDAPGDFSYYTGDFLEDFYLRDNEFYNDWVLTTRQNCRRIYQEQLRRSVARFSADRQWAEWEAACRRLIALDEFDESGYRSLMELYRARGEYSKAIALYGQLERLLAEELFQAPDQALSSLAEDIKRERNQEVLAIIAQKHSVDADAAPGGDAPFYGRGGEMVLLSDALRLFQASDRRAVSFAVTGEAGIGKTRFLDHTLHILRKSLDCQIFQARCYRAEEGYILKPWQSIFQQISRCYEGQEPDEDVSFFRTAASRVFPYLHQRDCQPIDEDDITTVNYDNSQRAMTHSLLRLARKQKFIIYFDDLQWADISSVSLIRDILTTGKNSGILFLLTCQDEHHAYIDSFLKDMCFSRFLREIRLERFGFEDTIRLADLLLSDRLSSPDMQQKFYRETEGNPFFIIETANNIKYNGDLTDITPNMRDTLRLRTMPLSPECRNILDLLSLFFDGASFEILAQLSNKEEYQLIEILDTLMSMHLIQETSHPEGIVFQFSHQKILEYVYGEMSQTKRRILHGRIAGCLEGKLKNTSGDVPLYPKLIYHFKRSGNQRKYLQYTIESIYSYLNRSHEYYPMVSRQLPGTYAEDFEMPSDSEGISRALREVTDMVEQHLDELDDEECRGFLSDYYHMMGRYHIRKSEYAQGSAYIDRLVRLNSALDSRQCRINMIKANRQLICIHINHYAPAKMQEVIDLSFQILSGQNKPEESAIWMRLAGLCDIMSGRLEDGRLHLETAISIFEHSRERDQYLFNLAASYAWLGEIERSRMRYREALAYYDHAISICTDSFLTGGIATFYTYAGQAALDSGDPDAAERYLSEAVVQFSRVELMWGRSTAFAYYGMLCLRRGNYREALDHLSKAHRYALRLESPYEQGILNRMFAQIASAMKAPEAGQLRSVFGAFLDQEPQVYIRRARELLQGVYSPVDRMYLEQLQTAGAPV